MIRVRAAVRFAAPACVLSVSLAAQPPAIREGTTKTGIAYDVQGRGPVVVLITGSNLDRRMWAREAGWLAKDHTVVRYDLRAHGQSAGASESFSHLRDLTTLLDELQIAKAALIGLSAGSTIALDAALDAPARVERIVLSGPAISGFRPSTRPPFVGDLMAAVQARDYRNASEVLLATSVFAAPPEAQALVRQMVTENERLWSVPPTLMEMPRSAVDRLGQVAVPTLVLIGDRDALQRDQADLLARQVPSARLVVVPGGGHLLNLTSPSEFEAAVREFLR